MDQSIIKTRSQTTSPSTGASQAHSPYLIIAVESPKSVASSSTAQSPSPSPSPVLSPSPSPSQSRSPQTTATVSTSLLALQLQYTGCDRFNSGSGPTKTSSAGMDIKANKVDTLHTQKGKKCALKAKKRNSKKLHFSKIMQKSAKNLKTNKTSIVASSNSNNNRSTNCTATTTNNDYVRQQQQLLEQQPQELQIQTTTKEKFLFTLDLLAVVRRNASDKLKLIQMVHDNPILWDSRLPNFKGAEEEKNRAWEHIGKEFNAPGRRVARAFKSLRESYRRELAHVKIMGNGFKPKWTLYEPMNFLRDVIRERKGGSHAAEQAALGLNLSAFSQHLNGSSNNAKSSLKLGAAGLHHSSFNESALNLSKCGSLNLSHEDYYYFVKPELDLAAQNNSIIGAGGIAQPLPAHMQIHASNQGQQPQLQQTQGLQNVSHDSRVTSTRNDNNSSSTPQNATFDDLDGSSVRSGDEASMRNAALSHQGSDEVEELDAIDADFPYPLILDNSSRASGSAVGAGGSASKRRRKDLTDAGEMSVDGGDDDDDYEGQMLQQHRQMRQQNGGLVSGGLPFGVSMLPPPQTMREVLNSQFCGFISAKLNSMEDSDADNLMNKILMLLVQTQDNTEIQNTKK